MMMKAEYKFSNMEHKNTIYIFKILGLTNNGAVWAWYFDLDKAWIALFCKIKILFKWVLYVDDQTILQ